MENLLDKHGVASAFAAVITAPTFASDSSSQSTHTGDLGLGRQSSVTSRLPQLLGAKLGSKVRPEAPGLLGCCLCWQGLAVYLKVN